MNARILAVLVLALLVCIPFAISEMDELITDPIDPNDNNLEVSPPISDEGYGVLEMAEFTPDEKISVPLPDNYNYGIIQNVTNGDETQNISVTAFEDMTLEIDPYDGDNSAKIEFDNLMIIVRKGG